MIRNIQEMDKEMERKCSIKKCGVTELFWSIFFYLSKLLYNSSSNKYTALQDPFLQI